MSKGKFIPPPPKRLEEIVASYGGIEDYLNAPEIVEQNNGRNAHDIFLLLNVGYAATARETGRNERTVKRWQEIKALEKQEVK